MSGKEKKNVKILNAKVAPTRSKRLQSKNEKSQSDHYLLTKVMDEEAEQIDVRLTHSTEEITIEESKPNVEVVVLEGFDEADEKDDEQFELEYEEIVEHVCGKCFKTFRRIGSLRRHIQFCIHDNEYHKRKEEMLKNIDKIEKEAVIMEKKDYCFCCGDSYDTYHLGPISCPECPKSFKTQSSYERHYFLTHSESDDFPCTICNAKMRTENLLRLHKEQHSIRGKPFACVKCGKEFTRAFHLVRHKNASPCGGNNVTKVRCKVCGKEFCRLDNLRTHLRQHLGNYVAKKPEYACPFCKKDFYSLSTLNIHVRTHTGERPYPCDLCEKKFPSLMAVKKHRRYHTGEKPYTCSVCNQSFAVKEVLNRHMKRHTGERKHACEECGKTFIQATQLKNHLRVHRRPYECELCDEKFKTEKQFERHKASHNKKRKEKKGSNQDSTKKTTRQKRGKNCTKCSQKFDNLKSLQFHFLKDHDKEIDEIPEEQASQRESENIEDVSSNNINLKKEAVENEVAHKDQQPAEKRLLNSKNYTLISNELSESVVEDNEFPNQKASKHVEVKSLDEEERRFEIIELGEVFSDEENEFTEKVSKLLLLLVGTETLEKVGWPQESVEQVLRKVIESCGHNMSKNPDYANSDYITRLREYVKLMFTVVIPNDSIKELLNNYPIDEVMTLVLGNADSDPTEYN